MIYKIIEDSSTEGLCRIVNEHIQDNWFPQGGICISSYEGFIDYFFQTIIKED